MIEESSSIARVRADNKKPKRYVDTLYSELMAETSATSMQRSGQDFRKINLEAVAGSSGIEDGVQLPKDLLEIEKKILAKSLKAKTTYEKGGMGDPDAPTRMPVIGKGAFF